MADRVLRSELVPIAPAILDAPPMASVGWEGLCELPLSISTVPECQIPDWTN